MSIGIRKPFLTAFIVFDVLLAIVLVALFMARGSVEDGVLAQNGVAWFDEPVTVGGFNLKDQYGASFTGENLKGNWHLIYFGFTSCPDVCPMTMQWLAQFYRQLPGTGLEHDTRVVLVSVDPLRDDPATLGSYLAKYHEDFIGLTGEYPQLGHLADTLYMSFSRPGEHAIHGDDYLVQHSDYVAVINPQGGYQSVIHAPHTPDRIMAIYQAIRAR